MNIEINFINNRRLRIGDFDMAIMSFSEVLQRYYDHPIAHFMISKCYFLKGDNPKADYHKSLFSKNLLNNKKMKIACDIYNLHPNNIYSN
jgi:hypothetical protein